MAIPFLATLSLTARTAYPIIRRGVAGGLSGNAINKVLRDAGLGIRRQTLFDIIRAEKGVEKVASQLRNLGLDRIPNPARLPRAITKLRRQYSFHFAVRGHIIDTLEPFFQNVTLSLRDVISRREMEAQIVAMLEDDPSRYPITIDSVMLLSGRQAGPEGIL